MPLLQVPAVRRSATIITGLSAISLALVLLSRSSYLLFHSLVELFSVAVAYSAFAVFWHARRNLKNHYFLVLGTAFPVIALTDALHMLSFKGMGVFGIDAGANLPTQLWIVARFLSAMAFLVAPRFCTRKVNPHLSLGIWLAIGGAAITSVFAGNFPDCFIEGSGLTDFKIYSEYLIMLLFAGAMVEMHRRRAHFHRSVAIFIGTSLAMMVISEFFFTQYASVYDWANLTGHLFKMGAFYLINRGFVQASIERPFDLLNQELDALSGLLPICAWCKKVRNDEGYWHQLDHFLMEHTDIDLTHSICPGCAKQVRADAQLR